MADAVVFITSVLSFISEHCNDAPLTSQKKAQPSDTDKAAELGLPRARLGTSQAWCGSL
jgi:hypothetical protein